MRRRFSLYLALALVLLLVTAVMPAEAGPPRLCLDLVETLTHKVVYTRVVSPGQAFTVWFLHSYDRAFFAEHYQALAPGRILLTHMTFKSNLNGGGFEYSDFHLRRDGVGELRNINEVRHQVEFMMGSPDMANHTLILGGERIPLVRFAPPGTLVHFQVRALPGGQDRKDS